MNKMDASIILLENEECVIILEAVDNKASRTQKKAPCAKSRQVVEITIKNVDNLGGF